MTFNGRGGPGLASALFFGSGFSRITAVGYLKGADLWHLAHALFLAPQGKDLAFLTLDGRQKEVAARLGFAS